MQIAHWSLAIATTVLCLWLAVAPSVIPYPKVPDLLCGLSLRHVAARSATLRLPLAQMLFDCNIAWGADENSCETYLPDTQQAAPDGNPQWADAHVTLFLPSNHESYGKWLPVV